MVALSISIAGLDGVVVRQNNTSREAAAIFT